MERKVENYLMKSIEMNRLKQNASASEVLKQQSSPKSQKETSSDCVIVHSDKGETNPPGIKKMRFRTNESVIVNQSNGNINGNKPFFKEVAPKKRGLFILMDHMPEYFKKIKFVDGMSCPICDVDSYKGHAALIYHIEKAHNVFFNTVR